MLGDGIDMYDLIPNLVEDDPQLYSTNEKFWVGVIEGMFPSPPVPRRKTRSYSAAKVYQYGLNKVFGMHAKNEQGLYMEFYKIPKREWIFIQ